MKIAIMQPYFFPYIGYFQLINEADRFILFDDVQYIRHGWINRNRMLKPNEGDQYIIVPLGDHNRDTLIRDIHAKDGHDWKDKILRQIEHYKKRSPYYSRVYELLERCFGSEETNITVINGNYIQAVCEYIGIGFKPEISSTMNFDYSGVNDAGEWALMISEQLGASEYINPPGGKELFDKEKFRRSNIRLSFLQPNIQPYNQRRQTFEPGLSILDIMMFNSPDEIKLMLNNFSYHE